MFPFYIMEDAELHHLLHNDIDEALYYSEHLNDEHDYAFANKLFNPFDLRDLEPNSPHFDIDSDIHYYNTNQITSIYSCKYFSADAFCKYSRYKNLNNKGFFVFHHSIRRLPANKTNLNIIICSLQHNFSVIVLTETWLKSENVNFYQIGGYNAYHNIRLGEKGGGVSVCVKDSITCLKREHLTENNGSIESINDELSHNTTGHTKNVIIRVVYRPPKQDINELNNHIKTVTDKIIRENKISYIMGDVKLDLFNHEFHRQTDDFLNTLQCLYSFNQLINASKCSHFNPDRWYIL